MQGRGGWEGEAHLSREARSFQPLNIVNARMNERASAMPDTQAAKVAASHGGTRDGIK